MTRTAGGILLVTLALGWLLGAPFESDGPGPLPFAAHRLDMALLGCALALAAGAVEAKRRRRRRSFLGMFARGVGIRVGLLLLGTGLLYLGSLVHSAHYWDYSTFSVGFHVLGPARLMAQGSLLLSSLGLSCTAEVIAHLAEVKLLGPVAVVYVLALFDALVLALLGMAGERGLPPFRVFQVVSRVGWTCALVSIPLAIYKGPVGYWGVEPFAWPFALLALALLARAATQD